MGIFYGEVAYASFVRPALEIRDAKTDRPLIRLNDVNSLGLAIFVQDKKRITELFEAGNTIVTCGRRAFKPIEFALFFEFPQTFCQWLYFEEYRINIARYVADTSKVSQTPMDTGQ
jgi:hypothetical protein